MTTKKDLKVLMNYAGKFKYLTFLSWLLSAISALLALVPFVYIWFIIRDLIKVNPNFSDATNVVYYGWMAVIFAISSMVIYFAGLMCSHISAFRIASTMRIKAMEHISTLPLGLTDKLGSGKVRRSVDDASGATETYLAHQLPDMFGAIATPCGMLILLFIFDWRIGLLSLIPTLLGFIIMIKMTGKSMAKKMKQYQNALDDMNNEAVEYIRGIPVVKTFNQTVFSFKRFKSAIDRYQTWVISYTKELRAPMVAYITAINSVFAILISAGIFFTRNGVDQTFLINLIFYIIFTPIISTTLTKIMYSSENKMIVSNALERFNTILKAKPLEEPTIASVPKKYFVELKNVSFRYPDSEKFAVSNISLNVKNKNMIALVGPSGGGKTTIANLIARFYDIDMGEILIGGINIKNIKKEKLNNIVSFVFQNSHLLKMSILENVRMSRLEATNEEVLKALHDAQCDDIVSKFPNGVNTIIGTKGVYLSEGEKQRIAIARIMLKNSPIIILDEATAFADPENESIVQKAFENLALNKTIIVIAHRLNTIKNASEIYVINQGKIEENGNHKMLINKNGLYKQMWNEYESSINWKVGVNDND